MIRLVVLIALLTTLTSSGISQRHLDQPVKEIHIGIVMVDISRVDNLNESVNAEFALVISWVDSSLVSPSQSSVRYLPMDSVNLPTLQIKNMRDAETFGAKGAEIYPDGRVVYRRRIAANMKNKFDFRSFPFDKQQWDISIVYTGIQNIKLIPDDLLQGFYNPDWITISDWKVTYEGQKVYEINALDFPLQTFEVTYGLSRRSDFFIWKVIVPMVLVVLMSWSVFWIDPKNIGAQLTVSVTAILTLIAFQFSVAQLLPTLPYLTSLDEFTIGADFMVFLAFMETIITSFLQDKGNTYWSDRIDHLARFIFPVIFIGLILITLVF
jgi:hypothetical protein